MATALSMGDTSVRLSADAPRLREIAVATLGLPTEDVPDDHLPALRLCSDVAVYPDRPPDVEVPGLRLWIEGGALVAAARGAVATVAAREMAVRGRVEDVATGFRTLAFPALAQLLVPEGVFLLHAAAVARAGGALLVVGGSGRGKSTLALAALELGWDVLADDVAVVRSGRTGPAVAGLARPPSVPADLRSTRLGPPRDNDPRRRHLLAGWTPARGWSNVVGLVRIGHGDRPEGTLAGMSERAALAALVHAFPLSVSPVPLRRFFPCAAALSRIPAWGMGHGNDAATRLAAAAAMLDRIDGQASSTSTT